MPRNEFVNGVMGTETVLTGVAEVQYGKPRLPVFITVRSGPAPAQCDDAGNPFPWFVVQAITFRPSEVDVIFHSSRGVSLRSGVAFNVWPSDWGTVVAAIEAINAA